MSERQTKIFVPTHAARLAAGGPSEPDDVLGITRIVRFIEASKAG